MTFTQTLIEIDNALKSLDYKKYSGKEQSLDKGGNSAKTDNKTYLLRPEAIDDKSITNDGYIGTYEFTLEILYTGEGLQKNNANFQLYATLITSLYNRSIFPHFFGLINKPQWKVLDNKQLGIVKISYGIRGTN